MELEGINMQVADTEVAGDEVCDAEFISAWDLTKLITSTAKEKLGLGLIFRGYHLSAWWVLHIILMGSGDSEQSFWIINSSMYAIIDALTP